MAAGEVPTRSVARRAWWVLALVALAAVGIYLGAPDVSALRSAWEQLVAHPVASAATVAGGAIALTVTEAIRIAVIGGIVGVRVRARDAWDAAVANRVMTAISPPVGLGEPTVAYTLNKRGVPWDAAVLIPFIKFTTSLVLLFTLGALLVAIGHGPVVGPWARAGGVGWFLGIAAVSLVIIALASRPPLARRWIARLAGWLTRRRSTPTWAARVRAGADVATEMVERLERTIANRPRRPAALARLVAAHLVYYAAYVSPLVGIAIVLGEPPVAALTLRALVYLCFVNAIPVPGGTGASEAAAGLFFADLVDPAVAIVAVAVFRAATFYLQLAIAAVYLPIRYLRSRRAPSPG